MLCLNYLYFSLMRAVNDATQFYKPYFDFLATKDSNRLRIFEHFFCFSFLAYYYYFSLSPNFFAYQFTKLNLASPYMFLLQSSLIASFFRFCQFDSIVTNSYSLAQDFCRNIYIFSAYYLPSKYPTIRYLDLYANYSHAVTILLLPDSHALQWNIIISYYFVYYAKKII